MRARTHARRGALTVAAAIAATSLVVHPSAAVDGSDGGLWYYTATGMEEVHQVTTGEGIEIALIDGLVNPAAPELAGANLTVREPSYCAAEAGGAALPATSDLPAARHTTSVTSMLIGTGVGIGGAPSVRGVAPGASVTVYARFGTSSDDTCPAIGGTEGPSRAFGDAVSEGADIIVVPGDIDLAVDDYVAAIQGGSIVVGAGGNDGMPVSGWPATLNGAVATGTVGPGAVLDPGSPTGEGLGVVAPGADIRSIDPTFTTYGLSTGSSNSAVYTAGALALLWSEYPDATSNQILQALVRTTDGTEHEPTWDEDYGFGSVHVRQLVASDPMAYPDENPFVSDGADETPTAETLLASSADPAPSETAEPGVGSDGADAGDEPASDEDGSGDIGAIWITLGVVAALVIIAVIVVALLRARARRGSISGTDDQHGGHHG